MTSLNPGFVRCRVDMYQHMLNIFVSGGNSYLQNVFAIMVVVQTCLSYFIINLRLTKLVINPLLNYIPENMLYFGIIIQYIQYINKI